MEDLEDEKPLTVAPPFEFPEKGDVVYYYNDSACKLIRASPKGTPRGSTQGVPLRSKNTSSGSLLSEGSHRKTISSNTCCLVVLAVLTIVALLAAAASLTLTLLVILRVLPLHELPEVTPTAVPPTDAASSDSSGSGPTMLPNLPPPCNCTYDYTAELQQIFEVQERLNMSTEHIADLMVMFDMLYLSFSTLATDIRAVNNTVASLQSDATSDTNKVNESSILSNLSLPAVLRGVQAFHNCSTVKAASCSTSSSLYTGTIPSFKYCETAEVPVLSPDLYNLEVTCAVEESTLRAPIVATLEVSENSGNMRCLCYVVVTSTGALGPNNLACIMYITRCPLSQSLQVTVNTD